MLVIGLLRVLKRDFVQNCLLWKITDYEKVSSHPLLSNQSEAVSRLILSLSNDIVKAHGGELALKSEMNNGTEITITLPI